VEVVILRESNDHIVEQDGPIKKQENARMMTAFLQLEANEPPEWLRHQYPRAAWRRPNAILLRLAPTAAGPVLLVGEARAAAIEREHGGKVEVDGICFPLETRPPAKKLLR
jgi:hypothetical protein